MPWKQLLVPAVVSMLLALSLGACSSGRSIDTITPPPPEPTAHTPGPAYTPAIQRSALSVANFVIDSLTLYPEFASGQHPVVTTAQTRGAEAEAAKALNKADETPYSLYSLQKEWTKESPYYWTGVKPRLIQNSSNNPAAVPQSITYFAKGTDDNYTVEIIVGRRNDKWFWDGYYPNVATSASPSEQHSAPPAVEPSSNAEPDVKLNANSTCTNYLNANSSSKQALINTIEAHLTVTYGSSTVETYVEVLDDDCPNQPSESIEELLTGLGYYGN